MPKKISPEEKLDLKGDPRLASFRDRGLCIWDEHNADFRRLLNVMLVNEATLRGCAPVDVERLKVKCRNGPG